MPIAAPRELASARLVVLRSSARHYGSTRHDAIAAETRGLPREWRRRSTQRASTPRRNGRSAGKVAFRPLRDGPGAHCRHLTAGARP